jgi:hypothetical protein
MKRKYLSEGNDLEEEPDAGYTDKSTNTAKRKANGSKSRGYKTSVVTRKAALEDDRYTKDVSVDQVTCKACDKVIKLHVSRPYETAHWDKHKCICPRITGKRVVRTVVKKQANLVSIDFMKLVTRIKYCVAAASKRSEDPFRICE